MELEGWDEAGAIRPGAGGKRGDGFEHDVLTLEHFPEVYGSLVVTETVRQIVVHVKNEHKTNDRMI